MPTACRVRWPKAQPDAVVTEQPGALSIQTALDNFGTGYNTLVALAQLPVKIVKIGRRFTADISAAQSCE
ncbi:EAL domain-containing protein [Deinococcus aerolatus]|uniref:EAL domain-containing protein n=1 Tax=Deinococcus aerolatus TaxID=522487 RepID=UPI003571463D